MTDLYKNHAENIGKTLQIAPMLDVTTREFRQLMRILSKRCVLWTEMVVDTTIIHTQDHLDVHLAYENHNSHPIIFQLGGSDVNQLCKAAKVVVGYGFDGINLNCDCPSNRVAGKRQFGAVLMKKPDVAARAVQALLEAVQHKEHENQKEEVEERNGEYVNSRDGKVTNQQNTVPVSVKMRIGVDDQTSLDDSIRLIHRLNESGCQIFHIHARSAILGGKLNPAQNRSIPPLHYQHVYDLCRLFPHCKFYLNGGIKTLVAAKEICFGRYHCRRETAGALLTTNEEDQRNSDKECRHGILPCAACGFSNGSCIAPPQYMEDVPPNLCGVLLGRIALDNPCALWDVDRYFYGEAENACTTRRQILNQYISYLRQVYPRRCCDRNPVKSTRITDPKDFNFEYDYCSHCVDVWCEEINDNHEERRINVAPTGFAELSSSTASDKKGRRQSYTTKISVHVMYRCVKPIQNIFFGLPKSQLFRRECDALVHNQETRNCGPASLIKRALKNVIPDEVLDRPLIPADETIIPDGDSFDVNQNLSTRSNASNPRTPAADKTDKTTEMRKETSPRSRRRLVQHRYPRKGFNSHVAIMMIISILSLLQGTVACWCNSRLFGNSIRNLTSQRKTASFASSTPLFFSDQEPPFVAIITEPDACSTDEKLNCTLNAIKQAVSTNHVDLISVRLDGNTATASPETIERAQFLTEQLLNLSQARHPLGSTNNDDTSSTEYRSTIKPSFYVVCSSDWVDVARRVRAHGIHVKESQLDSIPEWTSLFDYDILIGTSTHSVESALRSSTLYQPHYYFVGTCFLTESHPEKNVSELEGPTLPGIVKRSLPVEAYRDPNVPIPVFAIGGIDETNCMIPIQGGADGVAVIRSVLQADRPDWVVTTMYQSMKNVISER